MMHETKRSTLQGAALGGGLALLVFGFWFWGAVAFEAPSAQLEPEATNPAAYLFIVIPTLVGSACGAVLGFAAARFQSLRYLKLLAVSGGLYLFAAWAVSLALIIATIVAEGQSDPDGGGPFLDSLKLGFIGAVFMSPICGPLILLMVFVLERMTRPSRFPEFLTRDIERNSGELSGESDAHG